MTLPQREIMNGGHRNELFNYNNLQDLLPIISPIPKAKTTSTLLGLNAHLGSGNNNESEQNKREMSCEQPLMGSSRWNPTAEQLLALEEMYRRGTRTPTAEQIQQIASQLRRFGKIEGKNVFYWFQNHKARDRQKRRRELETGFKVPKHAFDTFGSLDIKESSGLRRTVYEADEQTKTLIHPSSCTNHYIKGPVSSTKTTHGWWSQFEERELQQDKSSCSLKKKNATWHAMDWYPPSSPIQLINNNNLTTTTRSSRSRFLNLQRQSKKQNPEIKNLDLDDEQDKIGEVETLELFPLCSNEEDFNNYGTKDKDTKVPIKAINTNLSPNQYFEFLPLKN